MQIDSLPENMALEISQYLSPGEIVCAMKANQSMYKLFKPTLELNIQSKAKMLFEAVREANIQKVIELIEKMPYLMFVEIDDPRAPKYKTTALKESFRVYCSYIFWNFLIEIESPDHLQAFKSQLHEPIDHITFEPMQNAYMDFHKQYQTFQSDPTIDINKCWLDLGKAQKKFMPVGMLREFLICDPIADKEDFYTIDCIRGEDLDWFSGDKLLVLTDLPESQNLEVKFDVTKLGEQYTVGRNITPDTTTSFEFRVKVRKWAIPVSRMIEFSTPNERGLTSATATPSIWQVGTGMLDLHILSQIFTAHQEAFQTLKTSFEDVCHCLGKKQTSSVMKLSK